MSKNPQDIPIRFLKGIGPKRAEGLSKAGVETVEDLFYHFPIRYQDRSNFCNISDLRPGLPQTISASVISVASRRSFRRRGFCITQALLQDKTGAVTAVWFNRPYLSKYLKPGLQLILYGRLSRYGSELQLTSPEFEILEEEQPGAQAAGLVPVYSLPEKLGQRYFRSLMKNALSEYLPLLADSLPFDMRQRHNLENLVKSILNIHFPVDMQCQKEAFRRLAFEEFLIFQLPVALRKLQNRQRRGIAHCPEGELSASFLKRIPFELTSSQKQVISEIKSDMSRPEVMHRLLQGDVGSGKTIVALIAALIAIQGGYQAAFMVPTEILARQHYDKISALLSGLKVRLCLLTGSDKKEERDAAYKLIKSGAVDLIIGTHSLIVQEVEFKKLGFVVIDEQHKFGVGQRALLPGKGSSPDVLIMSATPIPRTLAITIYGDLDISVINTMPPGRGRINTLFFSMSEKRQGYCLVKEQLRKGRQAFVVCPVIEESYALDIDGAQEVYQELKKNEFKEFNVGLLHGRLERTQQERVMRAFTQGKIDILVATTILEVGIDIPNASCMVIEQAERFGLSQLHQLRGRVGRGGHDSYCLLYSDLPTDDSKARMEAMVNFSDGFRIAEEDLKIRGPGEFFGARQHGLCELKIGNPLAQLQLLKAAREEAIKLVTADPLFAQKSNFPLALKLVKRFPEYKQYASTG